MQNLIVHLANVRTDFEVAEDLAELGDTLNDQSTDSLWNYMSAGNILITSWGLRLLVGFPVVRKQLLCCREHELFLMLIVKADQNDLELLEKSSSNDSLSWQDMLKMLTAAFQSLLKEARC